MTCWPLRRRWAQQNVKLTVQAEALDRICRKICANEEMLLAPFPRRMRERLRFADRLQNI